MSLTPLFLVLALTGSFIVGILAALLLARRREQALNIELAVLRSQVKTDELLARERLESLEAVLQKLKSGFDSVAGESLRANSETFLRLAREHLGQHQQAAVSSLGEREKAIETLLAPVREA